MVTVSSWRGAGHGLPLLELPYPLNWIPQSALRASDNVCVDVQTSEHNTNMDNMGKRLLSVTKEISTQPSALGKQA